MIRIGIVDDHAIVRTGLRQFLSEEVDLRVTGEAGNGRDALELARSGKVDVLVMDLAMPGQGGVDALAAIKARCPELPVLILSGFPEAHYAATLLRQGASGYLNKECEPQEIAQAIRTVARGRRYITPTVAEMLLDGAGAGGAAGLGGAGVTRGGAVAASQRLPHEALSARELQVFLRLAQGETVGEAAEGMFLSVKTVSTYRTRVLEKLKLNSNSDLTYYALKNGLIQ